MPASRCNKEEAIKLIFFFMNHQPEKPLREKCGGVNKNEEGYP